MSDEQPIPAVVTIGVLGPLEVIASAGPVELAGDRQRRLLAALVAVGPDGADLDRLAEFVWDDHDRPHPPAAHVRTLVSRLRSRLGADSTVASDDARTSVVANRAGGGYRLDRERVEVDSWRFERLVASIARRRDGDAAGLDALVDDLRTDEEVADQLERAARLFRGRPYEDIGGADAFTGEAARLEAAHLDVEERLLWLGLERGHDDAVAKRAGAMLVDHPYRERLRAAEVTALYRAGRQAEALDRLRHHRSVLVSDLGLDPAPALVELEQRILDQDPDLSRTESGTAQLRSYRLSEEIGRGAFAIVRKGLQPGLDREVAVKVIRAEFANQPDFIRRFEAEALLVANLEHPHIVPLYDYWREPDRACLVFRYLRGGNLEQSIVLAGGLAVDDLRRMVSQVGGALAAAHEAGVVHRDVKPANVLLDGDGNFYLGDFGIAIDQVQDEGDSRRDITVGSPAYASPEQLRRRVVGPATDVYSLGVTFFEAATGRLPYHTAGTAAELMERQLTEPLPSVSSQRPDLPSGIDDVLAVATATDPGDRFASVTALVDSIAAELEPGRRPDAPRPTTGAAPGNRVGVSTVVTSADDNPFKGLRPFTEADAAQFFGRERVVERLVASLARHGPAGKLLAVVGPSGIGKSSVVRAGLLPRLRAGEVPGSSRWFTASMVPGADPYGELATALLSVAPAPMADAFDQLADDHRGIARAVGQLLAGLPDTDVLLVIDQFEELFSQSSQGVARNFLDALVYALEDASCRLRLAITIRADFWDRPLRHAGFAGLLEDSTVHLSALGPDEIERSIVEPVHRSGGRTERGLVARIVADVVDQPSALPLLQFALTELWQRADGGELTLADYEAIGGVPGAVASLAEASFNELAGADRAAARKLFCALVTPGDGGPDTRRRVRRTDLSAIDGDDELIDRFGRDRLLTFDHHPGTREQTVDLAHEALLTGWPRLAGWLDEDRSRLRLRHHLAQAASAWDSGGRDDGDLYAGARLVAAEELDEAAGLDPTEREFLAASIAARARQEEARRRQVRRLRRVLVGLAAVAFVAISAGIVAGVATRRADREAANAMVAADTAEQARREAADAASAAETLVLASTAERMAATRPNLAIQLAVAAIDREDSARTREALFAALQTEPRFDGIVDEFGFGCVHVTSGTGGPVIVTEGATPAGDGDSTVTVTRYDDWIAGEPAVLEVPSIGPCSLASPDGGAVAAVGPAGLVVVDPAAPGSAIVREGAVDGMAWSSDGAAIATIARNADGSWTATRYRSDGVALDTTLDFDATQVDGISLAGDRLLVDAVPPVVVDFGTGSFRPLDAIVDFQSTTLSADGQLAVGITGSEVQLFDATTGERRWRASTLGFAGLGAGVSIDPGTAVIAVDTALGVELYDVERGERSGPPIEVSGPPHLVDDNTLLVLDQRHRLIRFSLDGSNRATRLVGWNAPRGGTVAADGSMAWTMEDGVSIAIELETGARSELPQAQFRFGDDGQLVGISADGRELIVIDGAGERRWKLTDAVPEGLEPARVPRIEHGVAVLVFHDPETPGLAENHVAAIAIDTGEILGSFPAPGVYLADQLGPDELLLGSRAGDDRVVDLTGEVVVDLPPFEGGSVTAAAPGPDGDILIGLIHGDTIRWSRRSSIPLETFSTGHQAVIGLLPIDDGVIAQHMSGEVVRWRWGADEPVARLAEPGDFGGLAELSADGERLFVPLADGVYELPVSTARWVDLACSLVGSSLDRDDWEELTGLPAPDEPPCG